MNLTHEQDELPAPPVELDETDRRLLDALQRDIPLCDDPWSVIGRDLSLTGEQTLSRVRQLKQLGLIRQISPIFDSAALGYTSTLVAAKVRDDKLDQAAEIVNQHPGVSHNYQRPASFNLWFTLAVPPGETLQDHLDQLAKDAGLQAVLPLPSIRTFHIGVRLHMSDNPAPGSSNSTNEDPGEAPAPRRPSPSHHGKKTTLALTDRDKAIIRLVQDDLPLVEKPFEGYCTQLGITLDHFREWMDKMKATGGLRRFAAILRHRATGFVANGMGVWRINPADPASIEKAGKAASEFEEVSHCYERPLYPDWPYNLYTMVHARTPEDCHAVMQRIRAQLEPLGLEAHDVLFSTREFKKERVRYFV
ncbi:MAG: AsnC family transcriptional regulator [Phycisphaera sp.]|nr:AsnC family transcriptional regulator [Phycisphaera sp.]